jgi:putative membrane protein
MKKLLLGTGAAALLISAVGCQSTETYSQANNPSELRTEENWASYPRTNPLVQTNNAVTYSPPVSGNYGQQVGATAWQDTRTSAPVTSDPTMADAAASLSTADRQFLSNAAMGGMYEIEAGNLAARRSESAKIREMANKIVSEHTSVNNEIKRIAQQRNVTLPTALDAEHRDMITKLDNADKASFDQEYLRQQAIAHRKAIELFEEQARNGKDEQAKQFASRTLPALQSHLRSVEAPYNTATEK